MISSLDMEADDYFHRLGELELKKLELERSLDTALTTAHPQLLQFDQRSGMDNMMNGSLGRSHGGSQNGYNAAYPHYPDLPSLQQGGSSYLSPNGAKRPFPQALNLEDYHPSKRQTPEPSNENTPSSSSDSLEMIENPSSEFAQRARQRLAERQAAFNSKRRQETDDERYARSISQNSQPRASSSSRSSVQTTLNHNGSFSRPPPPPKMEPPQPTNGSQAHYLASQSHVSQLPKTNGIPDFDFGQFAPQQSRTNQIPDFDFSHVAPQQRNTASSHVKPEPTMPTTPHRNTLVQRPRHTTNIIDLTNSDDDDGLSEIAPNGFTPNSRSQTRDSQMLNRLNYHSHGVNGGVSAPPVSYPGPRLQLPGIGSVTGYQPPTRPPMPGAFPSSNINTSPYVYGYPVSQTAATAPVQQLVTSQSNLASKQWRFQRGQ